MSYDKRWDDIATDWLIDSGVPDSLVDKYSLRLAQQLQDVAQESPDEIADLERDEEEAARDAHINRQIDEARGK